MTLRNLNQLTPGPKPSTINDANPLISIPARAAFFPFPAFGVIQYRDDNGYSNYNSMEATLDKRFSNGWTTRAVYTLSKSQDNDFSFGQNQTNFDAGFGASDFDVRHRFVLNGIYQLPFGSKGAYFKRGFGAALLGGCDWSYGDWTRMDSAEIWNGAWDAQDEAALKKWDEFLRQGERITAIGSSDTHNPPFPGSANGSPVGVPVSRRNFQNHRRSPWQSAVSLFRWTTKDFAETSI